MYHDKIMFFFNLKIKLINQYVMREKRETPAPRPNDKVRKIIGGFPSSVYITALGGRNKSALHALPKDKNPG